MLGRCYDLGVKNLLERKALEPVEAHDDAYPLVRIAGHANGGNTPVPVRGFQAYLRPGSKVSRTTNGLFRLPHHVLVDDTRCQAPDPVGSAGELSKRLRKRAIEVPYALTTRHLRHLCIKEPVAHPGAARRKEEVTRIEEAEASEGVHDLIRRLGSLTRNMPGIRVNQTRIEWLPVKVEDAPAHRNVVVAACAAGYDLPKERLPGKRPPLCPRKPLGNLTRLAGRYPANREIQAEVTRGIAVCIPGDGDSGRDAVARVISKREAGRVARRQIAAPDLAGNIRPLPIGGPVLLAEQSIAKIAQSMCKPLVALRIQKTVGPSGPSPCGPQMDGATCVRRLLPSPSRRSMSHHQMHLDSAVVPLAQTCQRLSEQSKRLRTSRVLIGPSKTAGRAHAN